MLSVTVKDTAGQEHEAAALDIESGPRTLRSSIGQYTIPDEIVPYLAPVGVGIVDPQSFDAPVGSRVKVRGRMIDAGVGVSVEDIPGKPRVFRGVHRVPGEPPGVATVIQMRGKPSVIHY